ncbi:MAG: FeoA family protein [Flavobacteriaceae bacterium]|nr:FeoA family protein [Flavobacteriaceae bacterium]MCY4217154.1 FeoA family protein [Flavobacteriaceae bacterium]MCY4254392.1 FeoA family protein [Flavobacteriaceae bacterium]
MISLDLLKKKQSAVIDQFKIEKLPLKLIEMGCLPGNEITLLQRAPFKDPIYLKVDQSYLAIRRETAKNIFVRLKS